MGVQFFAAGTPRTRHPRPDNGHVVARHSRITRSGEPVRAAASAREVRGVLPEWRSTRNGIAATVHALKRSRTCPSLLIPCARSRRARSARAGSPRAVLARRDSEGVRAP